MAVSPDDLARELSDIGRRFGDAALGDRRRVTAILSDRLTDASRDIRTVGVAIDSGAVDALKGASIQTAGLEIDRLVKRIETNTGLPPAITQPVLIALAYALRRAELPSTHATGTSSPRDDRPVAQARVVDPPALAPPPRPVAPPPAPRVATKPLSAGEGPVGRGGWLIPLAVYFVLFTAYGVLSASGIPSTIESLTSSDPYFATDRQLVVVSRALRLIFPVLVLAAAGVVVWAYLMRGRQFRSATTVWLIAVALMEEIPSFVAKIGYGKVWIDWLPLTVFVLQLAVAVLGTVYVYSSRRVRNTFTR